MTPKEIRGNPMQIFAEDFASDETVMKLAAEFKWDSDNTNDDSWSGCSKTSNSDEQVDSIYCIFWITDILLSVR